METPRPMAGAQYGRVAPAGWAGAPRSLRVGHDGDDRDPRGRMVDRAGTRCEDATRPDVGCDDYRHARVRVGPQGAAVGNDDYASGAVLDGGLDADA